MIQHLNKEQFTIDLFNKFNEHSIPYVLYKNYENFPKASFDFDIICDLSKIRIINNLFIQLCKKYTAKFLKKNFYSGEIEVVRCFVLFNDNELDLLRVEFYSGFYSLKSIIYSYNNLCNSNLLFKNIKIPSYDKQLIMLILILFKNITYFKFSDSNLDTKSQKYILRIIRYYEIDTLASANELREFFGNFGEKIIHSLQDNNIKRFNLYLRLSRARLFIKFFLYKPTSVIKNFFVKIFFDQYYYYFPPIGFKYNNLMNKRVAYEVKDILLKKKLVRECLIIKNKSNLFNFFSIKKITSREGLVIYYDESIKYKSNDTMINARKIMRQFFDNLSA